MQSIMKYLKYTCLLENEDYARFGPKYRKHVSKSTDSSLLHTSSSSRSSLSPDSSFEGFLRSSTGGTMDPYFTSLEENPEALFDILTIQSLQERYSDSDKTEVSSESFADVSLVTDKDFENFVREFPIDDSISECFASDHYKPTTTSMTTKYSQSQNRANKLKKKHLTNSNQDNHILSDDDSRSSDSKRSKLGNLFHRKPKAKENSSPLSQDLDKRSDIGEKPDLPRPIDGNRHIPEVKDVLENKEETTRNHNSPRKLPPLPKLSGGSAAGSIRGSLDSRRSRSSSQQEVKYWFTIIDVEEEEDKIIQTLTSWPEGRIRRLRDGQGNTLLHRAAMVNKTMVIAELGTRFSELTYDLNYDRLSSLEVAVQCGNVDAMETLLNLQYGCEAPPVGTLTKLLETAVKKGESGCLQRLLLYLPRETERAITLPKNSEGDTAAHIAAAYGHVSCLHVLIEQGYSCWTENVKGLHPLHIAVHHHQMACYHFLLLHQCCKCLLQDRGSESLTVKRLRSQKITTQSAIEQLERRLVRHQRHVMDTMTTSSETQNNIAQCLDNLYARTEDLLHDVDATKGGQLRTQLDNLRAEGERLQDLFEFSPLASTNEMLTKVLNDFSTVMTMESDKSEGEDDAAAINETSSLKFMSTVSADVQKMLPTSTDLESEICSIIHDVMRRPDSPKEKQTVSPAILPVTNHPRSQVVAEVTDRNRVSQTIAAVTNQSMSQANKTVTKHPVPQTITAVTNQFTSHEDTTVLNHLVSQPSSRVVTHSISQPTTTLTDHPSSRTNRTIITESHAQTSTHTAVTPDTDRFREKGVKFSNVLPTNRPPELRRSNQLIVRDAPLYPPRVPSRDQQRRAFVATDEESVCSNTLTLTSGITGTERTSDWTSRVDTLSAESTDSESDWWEDTRPARHRRRHRRTEEEEDDFYEEDDDLSYNNVVLNLENEDAPDEVLRTHRITQHLQSMERFSTERTDVVETVVTASGRRLGGRSRPDPSYLENPDPRLTHQRYVKPSGQPNSPRRRKSKERQRSKIKLFSHEDIQSSAELSKAEFLDGYGRTTDGREKRWDEVSLTDADEARENDKAWYELSEDEESIIQTWRSDEEDNQSRDYL